MSIRRVALSGRFGRYDPLEVEEDLRVVFVKGVVLTTIDIVVTLAVAVTTFYLFAGYMVAPIERGFYCSEVPSINKPLYPNTISTTHLLVVTLAGPFVVISLAEALFFAQHPSVKHRLRKFFATSTVVFLEYLIAFALCTFVMEAGKCYFGRLRPHFLSACEPDWSHIDCQTDPDAYIDNARCTGATRPVRVARGSGHSAAAVLAFAFLALYLNSLVRSTAIRAISHLRLLVLVPFAIWMTVCMVTRVTDCWHHPTDVLGGVVLGLATAVIGFSRRFRTPIESRLNPLVAEVMEKPHLE